jgi:hypothetical protein
MVKLVDYWVFLSFFIVIAKRSRRNNLVNSRGIAAL